MRIAIKAVIALVVVLIVGFIAATFVVNGMTRSAVEQRTGEALGSPAHLNSARVGLFTGNYQLGTLDVNNPEGFDSPILLRVKSTDGGIRLGTLFADVVEVPRLTLTDIEATLERRNGRANYDIVLQSIGQSEQTPDEGRRYIIRELLLQNVVITVDLAPDTQIGDLTRMTVRIPEMRLTDIGTEMDRGVAMQEVAGVLFKAIMTAFLENAGEQIPGLIASELTARLGELDAIPADIMEIAGERLGETLRDLDPSRLFRLPGRD